MEKGVGGAGDGVLPPAEETGDRQLDPVPQQLCPQSGFAAGTWDVPRPGGQGEDRLLHHDSLPALRAEIGNGALGLFNHAVRIHPFLKKRPPRG